MKIFISYSIVNRAIAWRIYNDLTRLGTNPWLYEIDGKIAADFEAEINQKIKETDTLCLIDSAHARKSLYVKNECVYAKNLSKKIIVCQVESTGMWREIEFFDGQNNIRYIDFSDYGKSESGKLSDSYDHLEKYRSGMDTLCETIGMGRFVSWSSLPGYLDFEAELTAVSLQNNELEKVLNNDYKSFILIHRRKGGSAGKRLEIIIEECEENNLKLISPLLALGAIQVESHQKENANNTYKKITEIFKEDPRGWAAFGASEFYCERYESSLASYNRATALIERNLDNQYFQKHYSEVIHNKLKVLLRLNRIDEARKILEGLETCYRNLPEVQVAEIKILLHESEWNKAKTIYDDLDKKIYAEKYLNNNELNFALADLERDIAVMYAQRKPARPENMPQAIEHYKKANELAPAEIMYKAELALLYFDSQRAAAKELIIQGLKLSPFTDTDLYCYGLLCFLDGNPTDAYQYYKKSKKKLPYYFQLAS